MAEQKRRSPGTDVRSVLLAQVDEGDGRVTDAELAGVRTRAGDEVVVSFTSATTPGRPRAGQVAGGQVLATMVSTS